MTCCTLDEPETRKTYEFEFFLSCAFINRLIYCFLVSTSLVKLLMLLSDFALACLYVYMRIMTIIW